VHSDDKITCLPIVSFHAVSFIFFYTVIHHLFMFRFKWVLVRFRKLLFQNFDSIGTRNARLLRPFSGPSYTIVFSLCETFQIFTGNAWCRLTC
jgi:hypothetical protein